MKDLRVIWRHIRHWSLVAQWLRASTYLLLIFEEGVGLLVQEVFQQVREENIIASLLTAHNTGKC